MCTSTCTKPHLSQTETHSLLQTLAFRREFSDYYLNATITFNCSDDGAESSLIYRLGEIFGTPVKCKGEAVMYHSLQTSVRETNCLRILQSIYDFYCTFQSSREISPFHFVSRHAPRHAISYIRTYVAIGL